jgi:hypothetical protein
MKEMKTKLQKLDLIRNTTDAMIAEFDLHPKTNTKRKNVNSTEINLSYCKEKNFTTMTMFIDSG